MDILFLSHCVPNPPDKGEKIRAFHELTMLANAHRVHLACFARSVEEEASAYQMRDRCASVYAEVRPFSRAVAAASLQFALGGCMNMALYRSGRLRRYVANLARTVRLDAAVVFTLPMTQYVPRGLPYLLDLVDVDSEKWFQYARMRWPSVLYWAEAVRLRAEEKRAAEAATCNFVTTANECRLLRRVTPRAALRAIENGVDFDYFDPQRVRVCSLPATRFVVFIGHLKYFPNVDAVRWFAAEALPLIRSRDREMKFVIVGKDPGGQVLALRALDGVTVVGEVPDVRPYLMSAAAVVAPLQLARGVQNKVLEALAMGRTVLASNAVCETFSPCVPEGVVRCESAAEFAAAVFKSSQSVNEVIRDAARQRFNWRNNFESLADYLPAGALSGT